MREGEKEVTEEKFRAYTPLQLAQRIQCLRSYERLFPISSSRAFPPKACFYLVTVGIVDWPRWSGLYEIFLLRGPWRIPRSPSIES